jgi:hypothetical protein
MANSKSDKLPPGYTLPTGERLKKFARTGLAFAAGNGKPPEQDTALIHGRISNERGGTSSGG